MWLKRLRSGEIFAADPSPPLAAKLGMNHLAVAIMLRTFLWARGARPQKCLRPNACGYSYMAVAIPPYL